MLYRLYRIYIYTFMRILYLLSDLIAGLLPAAPSPNAGEAGEWREAVEIVVSRSFIQLRPRMDEAPHAVTQSTSQMRP